MQFDSIFAEYYAIYRGQANKIPVYPDREYLVAIPMANAAIKKWERADGQLWRELIVNLSTATDGDKAIVAAKFTYAAPANMRKPPGFVQINGQDIKVVDPQWALDNTTSTAVWFTGGAQKGYTLNIPTALVAQNDAKTIEYTYIKKAALLPLASTPAAIVPDMSDPTYIIQDMLATRAQQARNGFVFKAAKAEASMSLANMKIENNSGTYGNTQTFRNVGAGWGSGDAGFGDMRL